MNQPTLYSSVSFTVSYYITIILKCNTFLLTLTMVYRIMEKGNAKRTPPFVYEPASVGKLPLHADL